MCKLCCCSLSDEHRKKRHQNDDDDDEDRDEEEAEESACGCHCPKWLRICCFCFVCCCQSTSRKRKKQHGTGQSSPCCSYARWISLVRALFMTLHTLLVGTSIFGLIWANVYYVDFDRVFTGTFIGGHLATLSAGGILFGLSGLYATIKRHRRLLYAHTLILWSAVLLRGFTWMLALFHNHPLPPYSFGLAPLEGCLAVLASVLLRDACIYF